MESLDTRVAGMLAEGKSVEEIISANNALHTTQEIAASIGRQDPNAEIPAYVTSIPVEEQSEFDKVNPFEKSLIILGLVLTASMAVSGLVLIFLNFSEGRRIRGIPSGMFLLGIVLFQRIYRRMNK